MQYTLGSYSLLEKGQKTIHFYEAKVCFVNNVHSFENVTWETEIVCFQSN